MIVTKKPPVGTVGLGLMGCSIATCILVAGHEVTAIIRDITKAAPARVRILNFLLELEAEEILKESPESVIQRLTITDDYAQLSGHELVIESILENLEEKKAVYHNLEKVLSATAIIGSNTSAIPVTILQDGLIHPERLLGIHWAEPAHITRFLEVICGNKTNIDLANKVMEVAAGWGKEPSLLKKDIRGFITNRIMYAMLREAFYLVENGYAEVEDVDRSLRNDLGYWITFAGPFRFMDLTGIPAYYTVMQDLFPELSNASQAPQLMREMAMSGAKGVSNAKGFYSYTEESAKEWEKKFIEFNYDIRKLAGKFPQDIGDQ